jgi:cytochrome c biogenesis protein CcmG/thiol:disulfide interchange protein DsbE
VLALARALAGGLALAVAGAVALGAAGGCVSEDKGSRTAPPFTLPNLTGGDSLSLAELRGRYVMMNFWASWCMPCRDEIPALVSIHRRLAGDSFTVLGVTVSEPAEDSRGFAREFGIPYPNVVGNDQMYEDYGLSPWIPVTLLIGPDGKVLREWIGPQTEALFLQGIRATAPDLEKAAGL